MRAHPDSDDQRKRIEVCNRISHRAASFLVDVKTWKPREQEQEFVEVTIKLLATLARARLWRRGRSPQLTRLIAGVNDRQLDDITNLEALGADAIERLALWRRRAAVRERKRFAMGADLRTAHRTTRPSSVVGRKSASACNKHLGESTDQAAADRGLEEWAPAWRGGPTDNGDLLAKTVDDLYVLGKGAEGDADELLLKPLDDEELLRRITSKFKGGTGVGLDWMRPRHISKLSRAARCALLQLLRAIESTRRWPTLLRSIIEIALGKKGGGARLVGQATAIYRTWAKMRFVDIRRALESRIARSYLPAAPGRGALQAAFDLAFDAETARSRGYQSASTCFDLKQYYEQV